MAVNFRVTPEELDQSADFVQGKLDQFNDLYKQLYNNVDELRATFSGETSEEFYKQIEGYRNDFEAAIKALNSYIQFLRDYAKRIRDTESQLKDAAGKLKVGK